MCMAGKQQCVPDSLLHICDTQSGVLASWGSETLNHTQKDVDTLHLNVVFRVGTSSKCIEYSMYSFV